MGCGDDCGGWLATGEGVTALCVGDGMSLGGVVEGVDAESVGDGDVDVGEGCGQGPLQPVLLSVGFVAGPGSEPTGVVPGPFTWVGTEGFLCTSWLGSLGATHTEGFCGDGWVPGAQLGEGVGLVGVVGGDVGFGAGLRGTGGVPCLTALPHRAITQTF